MLRADRDRSRCAISILAAQLLSVFLPVPAQTQTTQPDRETGSPAQSVSQPIAARLGEVKLKHLGTIHLDTPRDEVPAVRSVLDWDIDDQGRIGFYRMEGWDATFVVVSQTGHVDVEMPLHISGQGLTLSTVRWLTKDQWVVFANEIHYAGCTKLWFISAKSQTISSPVSLELYEPEAFAIDHGGGFFVYASKLEHVEGSVWTSRGSFLVSYDRNGQKRWRKGCDSNDPELHRLPSSGGLAVTTDGNIVVHCGNNEKLFVFDKAGVFLRVVDSGSLWYCTASDRELFPDVDGGVLITGRYGSQPSLRVRLTDDDPTKSNNPMIAARKFIRRELFQGAPNRWTRDGYLRSEIQPRFPDGREIKRTKGARVDSTGRVWICDGDSFFRLDEDDVIDCIVGENPDVEILRKIAERRIDPKGRTYLTSSRTGNVHVFDESGKRIHILPPDRKAFEDVGLEWKDRQAFADPQGRSVWRVTNNDLVLADQNDGSSQTMSLAPNRAGSVSIECASVAPNGAIAVIYSVLPAAKHSDYTLVVYDRDGELVRSLQVVIDGKPDQAAFDGKNVIVGTWYGEHLDIFDVESGISGKIIPKPRGSGPTEWREGWYPFFVKDCREVWLLHIGSRTIERYEAP